MSGTEISRGAESPIIPAHSGRKNHSRLKNNNDDTSFEMGGVYRNSLLLLQYDDGSDTGNSDRRESGGDREAGGVA